MWEPVALCCFSRRTGCLVLGSLEVIAALVGLIIGVHLIVAKEIIQAELVCNHEYMKNVQNCGEAIQQGITVAIAIIMVCAIVQLVCASMMIHGVRTNDHCLMCPYLIKNVIVVVLHIIIAGIITIAMCLIGFVVAITVVQCYGALIFTWTYFLLTVRAYYLEVKRGKADDRHLLVGNHELEVDVVNKP